MQLSTFGGGYLCRVFVRKRFVELDRFELPLGVVIQRSLLYSRLVCRLPLSSPVVSLDSKRCDYILRRSRSAFSVQDFLLLFPLIAAE